MLLDIKPGHDNSCQRFAIRLRRTQGRRMTSLGGERKIVEEETQEKVPRWTQN